MNCAIARALEEVGEWWTLLIVREAAHGAVRFDDFVHVLGISRNILTTRLDRLVELGIFERFPLASGGNAEGYRLTAKGEDLYPLIVALMQWGDRWLAADGKPRTVLLEEASGLPVEPICVRAPGGEPLSIRDIRFAPGPGATDTTLAMIEARNRRVLGCP